VPTSCPDRTEQVESSGSRVSDPFRELVLPQSARADRVAVAVAGEPAESAGRSRGWTVRDVAGRYRVGMDKVRGWIRRGELRAVNTATALCGKPRWVVTNEAMAEFERRRSSTPPAKPQRMRQKHPQKDYYPDD
jgi:hypothetical protein